MANAVRTLSAKPTTYVEVGGCENAVVSSRREMVTLREMASPLEMVGLLPTSPLGQVKLLLDTRDADIRGQDCLGTNLRQGIHERVGLCLRD